MSRRRRSALRSPPAPDDALALKSAPSTLWRAWTTVLIGTVALGGCALRGGHTEPCLSPAPAIFAPGAVSTDAKEASARFAADGRTVYSFRLSPGRDRSALLVAQRSTTDGWLPADTIPFSGRFGDRDPFVTADGEALYFASDRPAPDKVDYGDDLWVSDRQADGSWGEPRRLPEPINSMAAEWSPALTRSGVLYFVSGRPDSLAGLNVYRVEPHASGFLTPELIEPPLNSDFDESGVWVDLEEWLAVLAQGRNGRRDLAIAERRGDGWTAPRPLGDSVNTDADEFAPSLSSDGSVLYFTRDVSRNALQDLDASMDVLSISTACVGMSASALRALRLGR